MTADLSAGFIIRRMGLGCLIAMAASSSAGGGGGGGVSVPKCSVCKDEYQSDGDKAPHVLRCGHSCCAACVRGLIRTHPHGRRAAKCAICRAATAEIDVRPNHGMREAMAALLAIHMQTVDVPQGTSLTRQEYYGLLGLLGDHTMKLQSVYRASRDGTTYADLLRCVGDKQRLAFVIRKDNYVFGAFISAGLKLPDDPTDWHEYDCDYDCDVWHFSLAGHFPQPTKIESGQYVWVAGREKSGLGGNVGIGDNMWLGVSGRPAADIRSCFQYTYSHQVPAGYVGVRCTDPAQCSALLGGSYQFCADEIEVLHVGGT
ncbi:unnamed protein product [Vitrella brassicaformis CCMP3155]|uniref:RING-type domain-containing protein n=1 Tax=Vitrella brassicaformis (strain CCMP3155) TaxID=1169540 RepID=A0A0G4FY03_VITBC|nr:unnamed protein product [Vitrella brassicaformis CCMP3155]|eukprot:CEM20306.1 unnamed protein product [Vitrella brassicaformis CCMP3155]